MASEATLEVQIGEEKRIPASQPDAGFLAWTTWQLIDSILPTGGFAHSYGLEAAVQAGLVYDAHTLERFAVTTVENAGALLLPFVFAASGEQAMSVDDWVMLDCGLHAVMSNGVARAASVGQGKALVRLAGSVFKEIASEVAAMRASVMVKPVRAHGHHAMVVGRLLGLLGVDAVTAQRAYLYLTLRDVLSAATRLNLVGPMEAALLQHRHAQLAERVMAKYANRSVHDAYQIAPVLDTLQGSQTQLFSRLFCSRCLEHVEFCGEKDEGFLLEGAASLKHTCGNSDDQATSRRIVFSSTSQRLR